MPQGLLARSTTTRARESFLLAFLRLLESFFLRDSLLLLEFYSRLGNHCLPDPLPRTPGTHSHLHDHSKPPPHLRVLKPGIHVRPVPHPPLPNQLLVRLRPGFPGHLLPSVHQHPTGIIEAEVLPEVRPVIAFLSGLSSPTSLSASPSGFSGLSISLSGFSGFSASPSGFSGLSISLSGFSGLSTSPSGFSGFSISLSGFSGFSTSFFGSLLRLLCVQIATSHPLRNYQEGLPRTFETLPRLQQVTQHAARPLALHPSLQPVLQTDGMYRGNIQLHRQRHGREGAS